MKPFISFWIFAVFAVTYTYGQNVTSCYYCESRSSPGCVDPYDKIIGTSINCEEFINSLEKPVVRGAASRAVPFNRAFSSEKSVPDRGPEYRCVKTRVTHIAENKDELYRFCVSIEPTIDSACTFLKELASDEVVMRSCHECRTDNCNGSPYVALSLWSVFAFLLAKVF